MSSKRGNVHRSRPQKYQNTTAFKNDLHDKSVQTKRINGLQISGVCDKCKKVIEWKIKYKKFKPLKARKTCVGCSKRNVEHAYHRLCTGCANTKGVCPKCGLMEELVPREKTIEEQLELDRETQDMLKSLPERNRRTFLRHTLKKEEDKKEMQKIHENKGTDQSDDKDKSNPGDDKDTSNPGDDKDTSNPGDDKDSEVVGKKNLFTDDLIDQFESFLFYSPSDEDDDSDSDWISDFEADYDW